MRIIDCRGRACPEPVLATRRALENLDFPLEVRVDSPDALANISRMLGSSGYRYQTIDDLQYRRIIVTGRNIVEEEECPPPSVWVITSAVLGRGSDELGRALMKSFLHTLAENCPPGTIYFLNSGVTVCAGPDALAAHIIELEYKGWILECCGTCLDYYALTDQLKAGRVTSMYTIVHGIQSAHKVITV